MAINIADLVADSLRRHLFHGCRKLRGSPTFTAAAVVTLALGMGGTIAIVTLMDGVMLRPLPVSDPGRLYRIGDGGRHGPSRAATAAGGVFPFPLYERLQAGAEEFEDITAFDWGGSLLSVRREAAGDAATRPLRAGYVTGTYFSTLGVDASSGRVFAPDDDRPSAPPAVVLSHRTWQGAYGADPVGGRLDVRGGGPPVHGDRRGGAGVLRRDRPRVSARPLDSPAARADDRRGGFAAPPVDLAMAVRDRSSPGRRLDRGNGAPPDRHPAAVDPVSRPTTRPT